MKKSKVLAALVFILIIAFICVTFSIRQVWWQYIDVFCLFMAAFLHLLALAQPPALVTAARRIDFIATVFAIVGIIAFIGEAIAFYCLLS